MADTWLPSLITASPQEGFQLAITLSRRSVNAPSPTPRCCTIRTEYANDHAALTATSSGGAELSNRGCGQQLLAQFSQVFFNSW